MSMDTIDIDKLKGVVPYSAIAKGYDFIMSHVDYGMWSTFTDELLWLVHPNPVSVRELGCGTGTFALQLQPLGAYEYTATDICPEMIAVAKEKATALDRPVSFVVEDFSNYTVEQPHDVVILLYDGLNYLTEKDKLTSLFACTLAALKPGGVFFFDQSTPANSINNEEFFRDEGEMDGFSYVRGSDYNRDTQLHTTTFEIKTGGKTFFEKHVQRAYAKEEIEEIVLKSGFEILHAFDGFSSENASESSERIHWVVRKPE
ncbi:MAG: class I SAM-dependent methyltransferase [Rhodothermales bacterium]